MRVFPQLIVMLVLLVSCATAHAKTSTYECLAPQDRPLAGSLQNLAPPRFKSLKVQVSSMDSAQERNLDRLEIEFHGAEPLVFGPAGLCPHQPRSQIFPEARSWWLFSKVQLLNNSVREFCDGDGEWNGGGIDVEFYAAGASGCASLSGPGCRLLGHVGCQLRDVSPRRTADTATLKIDGKRLVMKLKDRLGRDAGPGAPASWERAQFVIDALWLGHGHGNLYLPSHFMVGPHDLEIYALDVEQIPGPSGDQTRLSVRYRDRWGEQVSESRDLRELLEQTFGPSP